jgi:hypothetical protein
VNVQTTVQIQALRLPYSDSWDRPIESESMVQYASTFERLIFIFTYQLLSRSVTSLATFLTMVIINKVNATDRQTDRLAPLL